MKKERQFGIGEPLTESEAALIYCIIGKNEKGLPPTVEEALDYFDPKPRNSSKAEQNEATACESLMNSSEQLTLF